MNLLKLEKKTVKVVKKASKIFRHGFKKVAEKDGAANIVTDADINIQHFLQNELNKILPQAGFLCEEENVADTDKDYLWVIDPIDGTTNFSRNIPECVISVGLLYKKQAVLGVVYAPHLNLLFTATKGGGAYCCGKRISVSKRNFEQSIFCVGICLYQKELAGHCLDIIAQVYPLCSDIRRFGSCTLEICYLAMGRCDLFFEIRTYPWDFAAAYLILSEAGGILKGYNNSEIDFNDMTMLVGANNAANFEKLNGIVSDIITQPPVLKE